MNASSWLIGLLGVSASAWTSSIALEQSPVHATSYELPLTFEVNQGQTDARVDFLARGKNYTLFLTATEAVFALSRSGAATPQAAKHSVSTTAFSPTPSVRSVVRMRLIGSAPDAHVHGLAELPSKVSYLRGKDPAHWRTNVRAYQRVQYTAVYPGVDLIYYGQSGQLEYDFIVAPGADANAIRLAFGGVDDTTIDQRGDLVLTTVAEPLRFHKPILYQLKNGRRQTIEGNYVRLSSHEIGFRVAAYDRTQPLIIDPVLNYSTRLGGSADDTAQGIAVDATGAAYITGQTDSIDFPTMNPLQPAHEGFARDAFVAKLTPDGKALIYATYLGGSDDDVGAAIVVDSAGAAYITGYTSSADFPGVHALPASFCEPEDDFRTTDAFVAKLAADGSHLIYSTCLGGDREDRAQAIAVDGSGAAYIGGLTFSCNFPTVNAFVPACHVSDSGNLEAFLAKFTPGGVSLEYSTYFGGDGTEVAGITVYSSSAVYIAGITGGPDFPIEHLQPGSGFVTKFAPGGRSLLYATQVGGGAKSIAVDASGAAYVVGSTFSAEFPTVNALQPVYGGSGDAFVVKLSPVSGSVVYATFLGSAGHEEGFGVATDTTGAAYVTGWTFSDDFPTAICGRGGNGDAFVTKLRPDGASLAYGTRLGGSLTDSGVAITTDFTGAAYVVGFTYSDDFPTKQPLQEPGSSGIITDAFITKFVENAALPADDSSISATSSDSSEATVDGAIDSSGSSGSGSITPLLAIVLALFAFVRAMRRQIRPRG